MHFLLIEQLIGSPWIFLTLDSQAGLAGFQGKQLLHFPLQGKPLGADVDPQVMARRTPGFSGADLSNLVNEAALSAAKHGKDSINAATLDEARDKVLMGNPRP